MQQEIVQHEMNNKLVQMLHLPTNSRGNIMLSSREVQVCFSATGLQAIRPQKGMYKCKHALAFTVSEQIFQMGIFSFGREAFVKLGDDNKYRLLDNAKYWIRWLVVGPLFKKRKIEEEDEEPEEEEVRVIVPKGRIDLSEVRSEIKAVRSELKTLRKKLKEIVASLTI
jgi:hypothetical protein